MTNTVAIVPSDSNFYFLVYYKFNVTSVIWLCPSSERNTSPIINFPQIGQTMSFPKTGYIESSGNDIFPTSQSNSLWHFLHSKLIIITLSLSLFDVANIELTRNRQTSCFSAAQNPHIYITSLLIPTVILSRRRLGLWPLWTSLVFYRYCFLPTSSAPLSDGRTRPSLRRAVCVRGCPTALFS